ncbi:MAG: glycosyltransferase family 39 protein [Candidatus Omnitrophica bacterium]|nr:glycosyltransferase family 39 protein [Candidatus Omnitrophota bacterium]
MESNSLDRLAKFLKYTLLAGGILYIAAYLIMVFFRIQYPFELEWEEGASLEHVRWVLSNHNYYVAPSLEFVPSIYTPLFFYISAVMSKILGVGFLPLRIISFVSSIGSFIMIYLMVNHETKDNLSAMLASCLFAATFQLSGSWFDIGRVDSFFLFSLLVGIYLLKCRTSPASRVVAAIFFSISFFTKQTALVISLPIMLYFILSDRRSALFFIIPLASIIGIGSVLFNYMSDGWFNFYVFELPKTTPLDTRPIMHFWIKDIVLPFYIAIFIAIFYIVSLTNVSKKQMFSFYLLTAVGMFGASWFSRYRGGGYYNVLLPAYAFTSILFGLGVNKLSMISQSLPARKQDLMKCILYFVCILQFGSLIYNPMNQIPSKEDLEAGWDLVGKLAKIDGEIYIPFHGYLNSFNGKKGYAHQMGMRDVLTTSSEKHAHIKSKLIEEIKQAMKERKFSAIIIDSEPWYPRGMKEYYIENERIFDKDNIFFSVTGMRTRPEIIYTPR